MNLSQRFFTTPEVIRLSGFTNRQFQYWDKTGFIVPSYRKSDRYRHYTFGDLVLIKFLKLMKQNGYTNNQSKKPIMELKELFKKIDFPFSQLTILWKKGELYLFNGTVLLNQPASNFIILSVGEFRDKLAKILHRIQLQDLQKARHPLP